jgi:nucleoside-triphosphatase
MGFELVTLAGRTSLLATKDPGITFDRQVPFGRYRGNLDAIDTVGVPALLDARDAGRVVVVDEIGPMEILSLRFRNAILTILDSKATVIGTVVLRPQPFADRVKAHPRVTIRPITASNRNELPRQILLQLVRRDLPHPPPSQDDRA